MFKRSFITVVALAVSLFAFGLANAAQLDGMHSGNGPVLPAGLQVFVNPGALGDGLIYGYYNARNTYNFFRVVNTSTTDGVAVKIRFREGRHSNEVLDFFICLSAADQWSAWIVGSGDTNSPATLYWYDDDTPTFPDPQANNTATDNMMASKAFAYGGTGAASVVTAEDTKEGYYEIIGVQAWADTPGSRAVKTPRACNEQLGLVAGQFEDGSGTGNPYGGKDFLPVTPRSYGVANVLMGNHVIFDVTGTPSTYAYNAVALGDCIEAPIGGPSLGTEGKPTWKDCANGIPGVNYVLTKYNEYVIYDVESALTASTDFINTFPTRRHSIEYTWGANNGVNGFMPDGCIIDSKTGEVCVPDPTTKDCSGAGKKSCCLPIDVYLWDDEEHSPVSVGFSPSTSTKPNKCWDVNYAVIGSSKSPLLDTKLKAFTLDTTTYQIGWVRESFGAYSTSFPDGATTSTYTTSTGAPVVSYSLNAFVNGAFSYMLPLRYDTSHSCYASGTAVTCSTGL